MIICLFSFYHISLQSYLPAGRQVIICLYKNKRAKKAALKAALVFELTNL